MRQLNRDSENTVDKFKIHKNAISNVIPCPSCDILYFFVSKLKKKFDK